MKIAKVMVLTSLLFVGANANGFCGNGVKDLTEQCDPTDSKHRGWGNRGCDENCNALKKDGECDENFYFKLRRGRSYAFKNSFTNIFDKTIKIKNKLSSFNRYVYKKEQANYNNSSIFPIFIPTEEMKERKGIVYQGEKIEYTKSTSKTRYHIVNYPHTRNIKNFFLKYNLQFVKLINYKEKGYFIHTTCSHYEITRCGDGIKDWYKETDGTKIYEACDPNDLNKEGWGKNGCDNSCQPKN